MGSSIFERQALVINSITFSRGKESMHVIVNASYGCNHHKEGWSRFMFFNICQRSYELDVKVELVVAISNIEAEYMAVTKACEGVV